MRDTETKSRIEFLEAENVSLRKTVNDQVIAKYDKAVAVAWSEFTGAAPAAEAKYESAKAAALADFRADWNALSEEVAP